MLIAHPFMGYLVARGVEKLSSKSSQVSLTPDHKVYKYLYIFSILGAIAPDLDTIPTPFSSRISHRYNVLHTPAFWIFSLILSYALIKLIEEFKTPNKSTGSTLGSKLSLLPFYGFFAGAFSHLVLDFPGGYMLLWPFSNEIFKLMEELGARHWLSYYVSSGWFLIELIIILAALFVFHRKRT